MECLSGKLPLPAAVLTLLGGLILLPGCGGGKPATSQPPARTAHSRPPPRERLPTSGTTRSGPYDETGDASYYGEEFAGRPTASGEIFDPDDFTAAHRTLPLGSELEVTNLDTGMAVTVRVNDRGPFLKNRILDCSTACARTLGYIGDGTARVGLRTLKLGTGKGAKPPPYTGAPVTKPAPPIKPAPAAPPIPPPSESPGHRPASEVNEPPPAANPSPSPSPSPQPPTPNPGIAERDAFAIQLGAFTDRNRASAQLNDYQRRGEKGYLQPAGAFLRVRLGPYPSESAAREALAALGVDGLVVREDNPPEPR